MISTKNISSDHDGKGKANCHAPVLPMSRKEMDNLGWECCDIIIVTGDAYVDHPSFGMALIGRVLESKGFRVGIISQPDWHSKDAFMVLGKPRLMFGVTAGNMDSMVNRYTANQRIRSDDAYTPGNLPGKRPDRSVIVYSQRCREAYPGIPIVIGGIEASLRRVAHYDYWSDKVRRSIVLDSKADILVYGNGEKQIVAIANRLDKDEPIKQITDLRGTAFPLKEIPEQWKELDLTEIKDHKQSRHQDHRTVKCDSNSITTCRNSDHIHTVVRLPSYEQVSQDKTLFALANRILHIDYNNSSGYSFVQQHGDRNVMINPPSPPLTTKELDSVYELPFTRQPHPAYGKNRIPAYEMIRFSVTIIRGCFGGCTFCSIGSHEGRIIQSRSEDSIIREIETIHETVPGFTGVISDLGGPTANMYRMCCNYAKPEFVCVKTSCLYPKVCKGLNTDHSHLIKLYRRARKLPGIKKILIGSGIRYDLAITSPEYIKELASNHVGGYLKIAPEHIAHGPLSSMMKPNIDSYYKFKELFDKFSQQAYKKQYIIPYFIAAHPGTTTEDMLELALWLKKNRYELEQVQTFLPSPMTIATAMYHSGINILQSVTNDSKNAITPRGLKIRRLHKAFLLYHNPGNCSLLRETLKSMGREDLIGNRDHHLVPVNTRPNIKGSIRKRKYKRT